MIHTIKRGVKVEQNEGGIVTRLNKEEQVVLDFQQGGLCATISLKTKMKYIQDVMV